MDGAPRTRILHPIWEDRVGWIATTSNSHKIRHLRHEPRVGLTYSDAEQDNVHVEAVARVAEHQADPDRIWDLFAGTAPPLGYDRALFWPSKTDPAFASRSATTSPDGPERLVEERCRRSAVSTSSSNHDGPVRPHTGGFRSGSDDYSLATLTIDTD